MWHKIPWEYIPENGNIKKARIAGKIICLIKQEDKLYATAVKCPHAGADLTQGWCDSRYLICPYHRHAFDLQTGRGLPHQGNYINIYPIESRKNGYYIAIKPSLWKRLFP
ncbi:Rieske (2Fe-2S) protein [Olivibacter sitiensis]|uniref:Rieske (2Fe-2S) protein n=1 Tax=Olivibacter sitiensis TaxID=376470 RepID=UPI000409B687|nr:Rieske 2Fe-2S domain-containing protein [Olivibacter sitiensis]